MRAHTDFTVHERKCKSMPSHLTIPGQVWYPFLPGYSAQMERKLNQILSPLTKDEEPEA